MLSFPGLPAPPFPVAHPVDKAIWDERGDHRPRALPAGDGGQLPVRPARPGPGGSRRAAENPWACVSEERSLFGGRWEAACDPPSAAAPTARRPCGVVSRGGPRGAGLQARRPSGWVRGCRPGSVRPPGEAQHHPAARWGCQGCPCVPVGQGRRKDSGGPLRTTRLCWGAHAAYPWPSEYISA